VSAMNNSPSGVAARAQGVSNNALWLAPSA
jgi:hypothetical protein